MSKTHILAIPYPAQGHVIPLMELSHELAKHGIKITFVNTEFTHNQILSSLTGKVELGNEIQLVSIPDGLKDGDDRKDLGKLAEAIWEVMPEKLEMLIEEINKSGADKITCVVVEGMEWPHDVAKKMGIKRAIFWPASAAVFTSAFSIQKLLDDGIIDSNGTPLKDETIHLAPTMPAMKTKELLWWACISDLKVQKIIFDIIKRNIKAIEDVDWVICNSTYDLEPSAFALVPKILPIGPLSASNYVGYLAGNFWPEDSTCLDWLDQQPANSVIYVAFGSLAVFDYIQLQELALGLELCNRPFLWVVRSDMKNDGNHAFLQEFGERVSTCGKVVQWAPQQKVLSHPSVACFFSHCGWNSTMEGTTNGVPFLCWPNFGDQFLNEIYICDIWKIGLRLNRNGGIITREEIAHKINQLFLDEKFKVSVLELKEIVLSSVKEGGSSSKNLKNFINWIKE